jgi:hypothetical protein
LARGWSAFSAQARRQLCQISSLSFVGPGGYVQLLADEGPGPASLDLKLPASGATIVMSDVTGSEIDRVSYGSQVEGVSTGRLPNGTGSWTTFPDTPSPGAPNYRLLWMGPKLNEFMARNDGAVTIRVEAPRISDDFLMVGPVGRVAVDQEERIPAKKDVRHHAPDLGSLEFYAVPVKVQVLAVGPDSYTLLWAGLMRPVCRADLVVAVGVEDGRDQDDEPVKIKGLFRKNDIPRQH